MDHKAIFKYCKGLGCCDACCLRYIGIKNPNAYENITNFITKYQDEIKPESDENKKEIEPSESEAISSTNNINSTETNNDNVTTIDSKENSTNNAISNSELGNGSSPPHKKRKLNICVSCLGVLQEDNWQEGYQMVKDLLDKKGYECTTFACALSSPIATLLREKAVTLHLVDEFPQYDAKVLTPLKEAWKWSFGVKLGAYINKVLDSGAISPLLVTVNMDYMDDLQELEILKTVSPQLFAERNKQKRRFVTEFTRRSVEQALEQATLWSLAAAGGALRAASARAACVGVSAAHAPLHLAARYIKLSRNLPQSPWILDGKRVLPSSVQEIIFAPLAKFYKFNAEDADRKLKFIAAGREDVDVRCLGDGRPFAVEISDPPRQLTEEELTAACKEISDSGQVIVRRIVPITKEDLVQLKKGEETKSKTYEALCIKLSHSKYDKDHTTPVRVTSEDIERINTCIGGNDPIKATDDPIGDKKDLVSEDSIGSQDDAIGSKDDSIGVKKDQTLRIQQKTPLRVLHRRPLLTRSREILELNAKLVPDRPQLFILRVRTSAGTYVKEWVHGELQRSKPSLRDVMSARVDLLALDVSAVHLDWPPTR